MKQALIVHAGRSDSESIPIANGLDALLDVRGFQVRLAPNLDPLGESGALERLDLIVYLGHDGEISPVQVDNLLDAVRGGCGLAAFGLMPADACPASLALQMLSGGRRVGDFPRQMVHVSILADAHPILQGADLFSLETAPPWLHIDPANMVLVASRPQAGELPWSGDAPMPLAWVRHHGKGRVFFSFLGGRRTDYEVSPVIELAKRGLLWTAR